ncbi:uncharacterized protein VTP21DRAFT_11066 [Calcarisporiella thermophila]|uniref:uncharacterized protein n=1 Tax=Calcarisporiella thermophila TaxID=911321 RepID=UPI0037432E8A
MSHEHDEIDPVKEEQNQFKKVLDTFAHYKSSALSANQKRRADFQSLPKSQQALAPNFLSRLESIDNCIIQNYEVLKLIVSDSRMFINEDESDDLHGLPTSQNFKSHITEFDMDKLRSTIKQIARDWSEEGRLERESTYLPIIKELNIHFNNLDISERGDIQILVPGAGLGRLAYDIACQGYSTQGNEFSFYMLLTSHFILNRAKIAKEHTIFPYIHSFSNVVSAQDQLQPVLIPDIAPGNLPSTADFSMVAGDFLEVYGEGAENLNKWDAVVTSFFIDTAKNIIDYIQAIYRILKPGGIWINIGPLLYHFENMHGEISIELSLQEVMEVVHTVGFKVEKEKRVPTTYTANRLSMLQYVYECAYFVALKPENPAGC